jgi:uncharacterized protein YbdZ (MbtH family)
MLGPHQSHPKIVNFVEIQDRAPVCQQYGCKLFLVEWIVWASGEHESFGDAYGSFFVVVSGEEHSLWRVFADVPAGWRAVCGEAERTGCRDYIEAHGNTAES